MPLSSDKAQIIYRNMLEISNNPSVLESGKTRVPKIVLLQAVLRNLCYDAPISGKYDSKTSSAVKKMQADAGLSTTGKIDPKTAYRLYSGIRQAIQDQASSDELARWVDAQMRSEAGKNVSFVKSVGPSEEKPEEDQEVAAQAPGEGFNWQKYIPYIFWGIPALFILTKKKE